MYTEWFDENTNPNDIPTELERIIKGLRSTTESGIDEEGRVEEIRYMAEVIYDTYLDLSTLHMVADRYEKQIALLKSKHRERLENVKEREIALKDKYVDQRNRERDKQNATQTRHKIRNLAEAFANMLTNPA